MATAPGTAASREPETQKAGAATPASAIFFSSNSSTMNSALAIRVQYLRLLGITGQRANLLSELAWEAGR
jgi:hypothetical protein